MNNTSQMNNIKIRKALAFNMLKYYQLDSILGVSEATRCRMLREELPEEEQDRICNLIEAYMKGVNQNGKVNDNC